MFTGIVECLGQIEEINEEDSNVYYNISSLISNELHIDQSVSHNGVCLTVTHVSHNTHRVTAIAETLLRSNLKALKAGHIINLERCVKANSFLDGHIVQGHVDTVAQCISIENKYGSYEFTFRVNDPKPYLLIDKGSIAINGVSLTLINPTEDSFKVAIIPYTFENTTFKSLQKGETVNIEYDVIGKYVARLLAYNVS